VQKTGGPILTIYTLYGVFLHKECCLFGVVMISPVLKFLVALNF